MGAQLTAKMFREMTIGEPADGSGQVAYVAGTPVSKIKNVHIAQPGDRIMATVEAAGYQVGGSHGEKDVTEDLVVSDVLLSSIVVVG